MTQLEHIGKAQWHVYSLFWSHNGLFPIYNGNCQFILQRNRTKIADWQLEILEDLWKKGMRKYSTCDPDLIQKALQDTMLQLKQLQVFLSVPVFGPHCVRSYVTWIMQGSVIDPFSTIKKGPAAKCFLGTN